MLEISQDKSISIRAPVKRRQSSLCLSLCSDHHISRKSELSSYQTPLNQSTSKNFKSKSKLQDHSCSNQKQSLMKRSQSSSFKPIQNSQKYMKQLLEKAFNKSLELINAGEILTHGNLVDVLSYLGFFSDPPTSRDLATSKQIVNVLDKQNRGIKRFNLLKLIYIISKIPLQTVKTQATDNPSSGLRRDTEQQINQQNNIEIGLFNTNEIWMTTQEDQKMVRDLFGYLYFNKISNENVKYIKNPDAQQYSFKPKILSVSSNLGKKHRNRVVSNVEGKSTQELLILQGKLTNQRILQSKEYLQKKQTQSCTFKPKTNKTSIGSKHMLLINKPQKIQRLATSLQRKQLRQLKECSFKPKLFKQKQNIQIIPVKNQLKNINRLKEAYNKRVVANTIKDRGYPKQVNWNQYFHNFKNVKKEKKPILSIDIKISNSVQLLNIYQGESLESIVCKILVKNKLPYQYQQNVEVLLKQVLEGSMVVEIKDGFIYSR